MKTDEELIWEKYITEDISDDYSDKFNNAYDESEELRVAITLMKDIKKNFPKGEIYIVGGVGRDIIMGGEIDDVDLATNIPFEGLEQHYKLRNISKNDSQPVYTILWGDYAFDLAKFREDSGDVGRQNNISTETDSFATDTKRRDITINSFGIDENGKIVDHQNGMEDIKNKIIRAVGNPKERFMEDATRILRVFRFASKMGFDIEQETLEAAKELKNLLEDKGAISKESIAKEFYKSAKSGNTLANFVESLLESGILQKILPEFSSLDGFTHNPKHHPEGGSTVIGHILEAVRASPYKDPVINLAVLFHDLGKAVTRGEKGGHSTYYGHESAGVPIVEKIFDRLKFNELSSQDKKNILVAVSDHMKIHNLREMQPKKIIKLVHSPSWDVLKAVGYCDEASRGSLFDKKEFEEKITWAENLATNVAPDENALKKKMKQYFDGNKLKEWYPELQGKEFGEVMKRVQDYIQDMFINNQEPTENGIKEYIQILLKECRKNKSEEELIWEAYKR